MRWPRPFRRLARFLAIVCLGIACLARSQEPQSAVFNLDNGRQPLVSLDSGWRFHPGDDPAWADPSYDDSAWPLLRANESWSTQGYPGLSGFAWYRFTLRIPAQAPSPQDARPARNPASSQLAIELAPILTTYQLYFDGHLAGEVGAAPGSLIPKANWNYAIYPLPDTTPGQGATHQPSGQPRTIHVAIRVWHSPIWASYLGGGIWAGENLLGSTALLEQQQQAHFNARRLLFVDRFCYAIAATIIGLTIFTLYLLRPREREYLWFALLLLVKAAEEALTISKELYAFPSIPIFDLLDALCVALAQAALLLFLANVLRLGQRRLRFLLLGLIALSCPLTMLYWPGWLSVPVSALVQILCLLPSALWMLSVLAERAARRDETARLLLVPVLLVQGLWIVSNVLLALLQFGWLSGDLPLDMPFIQAPFRVHASVLAELIFLLAMLIFLIRRFTAARRREERFETDLEAARQVQQLVLPARVEATPGFSVECLYFPAELVGGDFFQIVPTPDGGLLILAGDVAGKGLPAALMVSMLVGIIRSEAVHTSDPATLLTSINNSICGQVEGKFTTCLCLYIDAQGQASAANAGHLNPYRDGAEILTEPALPLGILPGAAYTLSHFTMHPGDCLTIVSDGVLEAQSHEGELFGFERTSAISCRTAPEIAQAARDFGQNDDITVLTITYLGSPTASTRNAASPAYETPA